MAKDEVISNDLLIALP